jgi:uncharacterized protein YjiS (DUF1127 family)
MKAMTRTVDRTLTETTSGTMLPPVSAVLYAIANAVRSWEERRITRQALKRLDAHMLTDIGLSNRQAEAEAAKPFWQD